MIRKSSKVFVSNGAEFCAIVTIVPKHSYTTDSSLEDKTNWEACSSILDNRLVPTIRLIFSQCDLISISATPRGRRFCDVSDVRGTAARSDDCNKAGGEFVLVVDADVVDDATVVALFRRTA